MYLAAYCGVIFNREHMSKLKVFGALLLASTLLVGCQSTAKKDYGQLISTNKVALTNIQAIENSEAIVLDSSKPTETKIALNDSVIQFGKYRSNYKLFEFDGVKGDAYAIELRSLCDCLGFSKTVLYPVAYVIDDEGTIINDKPVKLGQGSMGFSYPMNIHGIWSGSFPKTKKYYFLVAADNRNLESSVANVNAQMVSAPYASISVPMTCDVKGELEIKLVLN
jgi:hypothetical protein